MYYIYSTIWMNFFFLSKKDILFFFKIADHIETFGNLKNLFNFFRTSFLYSRKSYSKHVDG